MYLELANLNPAMYRESREVAAIFPTDILKKPDEVRVMVEN